MGVVHKLTDDVIDFIVKQKQFSPAIGCRRLSEVVADQFQIHVSKSSISTILQEAHLSSPVGRRGLPVKKSPAKFKIPEGKKKEIFHAPKIESAVKGSKPVFRMRPSSASEAQEKKPVAIRSEEMSNLESVPTLTPLKRIDKAGAIFLKASQWDMAGTSILGKVLKEEFNDRNKEDCDRAADLAFCFDLFGISNFSTANNYKGQGLWAMNDSPPGLSDAVANIFGAAQKLNDFGMRASVEAGALLQRITSFKLMTEDGTVFFVDAQRKTISFDNVQSEKGIPLAEAVRIASEEICGNVQSVVFHYSLHAGQEAALPMIASKLANAFNHFPGQGLKEISLHDATGAELAKYPYGVAKKKGFVLAIWGRPSTRDPQNEIHEIEILNKKFYFWKHAEDEKFGQGQNKLQAIALSTSSEKASFVTLLTNLSDDLTSQRKALACFVMACPGLGTEGEMVLPNAVLQAKTEINFAMDFLPALGISASLEEGAGILRQVLDHWGQHYFFGISGDFVDEKVMRERFYDLEGNWQENTQCLAVSLILPAGYAYTDQLKNAVARVNQQVLCDSSGRRVLLSISPAA